MLSTSELLSQKSLMSAPYCGCCLPAFLVSIVHNSICVCGCEMEGIWLWGIQVGSKQALSVGEEQERGRGNLKEVLQIKWWNTESSVVGSHKWKICFRFSFFFFPVEVFRTPLPSLSYHRWKLLIFCAKTGLMFVKSSVGKHKLLHAINNSGAYILFTREKSNLSHLGLCPQWR